ncbi:major facilitator superfamily domain-containing protein [Dactylonectria macrodidyma]|uniref:Major facilitator superfamily domain-containing protein n=1 Tax=Dactylonectria macrodidyma TaxID=307937 RepID=A0A9P9INZ8_9HYPO|nr:major facilitator superfamily domain-containing protein [Dactylonectria macrodidyma]
MNSRHAEDGNRDIVLIPTPSDDPDDPLNWSHRRKTLLLSCLCVYCLAIGIASAAIYSVLVPISIATDLTVGDLNAGTGYMFLTLGWGCLIWQPLAQKLGKRPVYLLSLLGTLGMMLWAPYTKSNGQWIANKVIQGMFGAPIESLCEISVADVYFTHERGTYVGLYALFLAGSNFLAPVISGFINDGQGWQWVLHWCAIFNGVAFVILFFCMEETNYQRAALHSELEQAIQEHRNSGQMAENTSDEEKATKVRSAANTDTGNGSIRPSPQKSYLDKIKIFRRRDLTSSVPLMGMVIRPFAYFSFPVVVFCGFMYGAVICYFNVLNATASLILSSPPYNFSASMVGLSYVSSLIGVCLGTFYSGPLGDKFVLWKARRNNGIMEPEYRLWLYVALIAMVPSAMILWGVGAAHQVHWVGLMFAMGAFAASITIGCQLPISYCIDCYRDLGADAIVTVILIRNTMSFAVSYGVTPWIANMGYQNAFIVAAFTALAQISLFLVFIRWGRQFRKASVDRYWMYVQQVKDDGLLH